MDDFDYKGYIISSADDGNYLVAGIEFPSLDEAMDWVDDAVDSGETDLPEPRLHTYLLFYIDNATDRAFEAKVVAKTLSEAKSILRQNYDVYAITDYTILD